MQIIKDFLPINEYTRPDIDLHEVLAVIIHYTAVPNGTAQNIRDAFAGWSIHEKRYGSTHYAVDSEEIIQMIPEDEVSYGANEHPSQIELLRDTDPEYRGGNANLNTIQIEICIEDDWQFATETEAKAIQLAKYVCDKYGLDPQERIFRHYDVTGKDCPRPYISEYGHGDDEGYYHFKNEVSKLMDGKTVAHQESSEIIKYPLPSGVYRNYKDAPNQSKYAVKQIQRALNAINFNCGAVDGYYGDSTENAVYRVQLMSTIANDGIYGDDTKKSIIKMLKAKGKYYEEAVYEIVDKGETLWGYTQKYNITVHEIEEMNPDIDANALQIGQRVRVK